MSGFNLPPGCYRLPGDEDEECPTCHDFCGHEARGYCVDDESCDEWDTSRACKACGAASGVDCGPDCPTQWPTTPPPAAAADES